MDVCPKISYPSRDVKKLTEYILKMCARECRDADMKSLELIWKDTDTQENLIEVVCKRRQNEEVR